MTNEDTTTKSMQLGPLFATPLAVFDASKFIDYGMYVFDNTNVRRGETFGGFTTSLSAAPTGKYDQLDFPNSQAFKDFISECARGFAKGVGYITDDCEFKVERMWMNEMQAGHFHNIHSHYDGIFSGCFYVQMPKDCAGITFHGPLSTVNRRSPEVAELSAYNSIRHVMNPKAGDLLIWESHLRHEVLPSGFEGARRCICFDISYNYVGERNA